MRWAQNPTLGCLNLLFGSKVSCSVIEMSDSGPKSNIRASNQPYGAPKSNFQASKFTDWAQNQTFTLQHRVGELKIIASCVKMNLLGHKYNFRASKSCLGTKTNYRVPKSTCWAQYQTFGRQNISGAQTKPSAANFTF